MVVRGALIVLLLLAVPARRVFADARTEHCSATAAIGLSWTERGGADCQKLLARMTHLIPHHREPRGFCTWVAIAEDLQRVAPAPLATL
jgi:hypothetical protein